MAQRSGLGVSLVVGSLLLAACSSGSDDSDADTTSPPEPPPASTDEDVEPEPEPEPETDAAELDSGSSFVAGDIEFRAVNLTDEPVDLYVRTSGFIEAFLVEEGFAPGAVSDFVAPPADQGRFLVTTAGAGDATCVIDCDHIITELTAFPDEGPVRTVLIHPDDGSPAAFEFWEQPTDEALDSGNAMIDADPARTLAAFSAVAIVEPDFGYRVTTDGVDGCLADVNDSDLLIGGNQIIPYDFSNASEFTLHAFEDQECSEAPVGGPFPFSGTQGARYHVMMHGTPDALEAFVLPMVDGATDADAAEPSADDSAARDEAIGLMAAEVNATFGLAEPEASCVATLLVDRVGAELLVVDGALVDLDSFPDDVNQLAGEALVASVAECGIDPTVFA